MSRHPPPGGGPSGGPPAVFLGCKVGDSAGEAEKKEKKETVALCGWKGVLRRVRFL